MQPKQDLREIVTADSRYIDCYVSTDGSEVVDVLESLGYGITREETDSQTGFGSCYDQDTLWDLLHSTLQNGRTGLLVECIDVPLGEASGRRADIGFMPMSKFRVHTNGSTNVAREIERILKALSEERQNMAFMDEHQTGVYVDLSEFYC